MHIQYISDLHLEFYDTLKPETFVEPCAPFLVLAGDIGIPEYPLYKECLKWCSSQWQHVFVVAGNHEFYSQSDMPTKKILLQTICSSLPNVHFLDCSSVYLPEHNVRVLGCTLWSHVPEDGLDAALSYMNDVRQIKLKGDLPFTPWAMTELHAQEKAWLDAEISACAARKEKCLVLTHYLPSFALIDKKYEGSPLNCCFASHCDALFRQPVVAWICGHTHTGMRVEINGIPCYINPHGYPNEFSQTRNKTATLCI